MSSRRSPAEAPHATSSSVLSPFDSPLSRRHLRLTVPAETRDPLICGDLADRRRATRAGLPTKPMDPHEVPPFLVIERPVLHHGAGNQRRRPRHHRQCSPVELPDVILAELRPRDVRVDLRFPEDLVAVGVADTLHEFGVCEDTLELPAVRLRARQPLILSK